MNSTPRAMRLHIAIFGRANVGKSTFLNLITGQDISITSALPGTTTDAVEKAMEFAPAGPVVFIDTAGFGDQTDLGRERMERTGKIFARTDVAVLVAAANEWSEDEENICRRASELKLPVIAVINKCDLSQPDSDFIRQVKAHTPYVITASCLEQNAGDTLRSDFRNALTAVLPENFLQPPPLLGDLIAPGNLVIMIVPVDLQAPKGRLILPQVQAIRDALDNDCMILTVKENRYPEIIKTVVPRPDLVICDSQVVKMMIENTPADIPCTTFSVLFSRLKGDTKIFMQGCRAIDKLQDNDRILIAEACTHIATCEDIGRVKLPNLLKKYTGKKLEFDFAPGRDFPEKLEQYKLIVHCGSCMLNRQETLYRIACAQRAQIPITNYGMAISHCQSVLDKVLVPE